MQRFEHPGFVPPVLDIPQALKGLPAYLWIGGERGHHEGEARLAIRICDAIVLRFEDLRPAGHCGDSQFEGHIDLVGFAAPSIDTGMCSTRPDE